MKCLLIRFKRFDLSIETKMGEATAYLAKAKSWHDDLEAIYTEAMDFSIIDKHKEMILNEIQRISEENN